MMTNSKPQFSERAHAQAKRLILKTPFLSTLGKKIRARQLEQHYLSVRAKYEKLELPELSPQEMFEARSGDRLKQIRQRDRPLRIFYIGTNYDQDGSGLLQGLASIGHVEVFRTADGTYGHRNEREYQTHRVAEVSNRALDIVRTASVKGKGFDIVMGQMMDGHFDGRILGEIQEEFGCLTINIAMDDRHCFAPLSRRGVYCGVQPLIPWLDLALTAAPEAVDWYLKEGCPALYFPEASDPDLFTPPQNRVLKHDVSFVGQNYGQRKTYVTALRNAGVQVTTYGSGWPEGRISLEEMPRLFSESRIVLGLGTVGQSENFLALKLRDFDAPMSGACYLTHDNPDLHSLFVPDKEIVLYRSTEDLVSKAKYLLSDEERCLQIGAAARARALRDHSWATRFDDVKRFLFGEPTRMKRNSRFALPFLDRE